MKLKLLALGVALLFSLGSFAKLKDSDHEAYQNIITKKFKTLTPFSYGFDVRPSDLYFFFVNDIVTSTIKETGVCKDSKNDKKLRRCIRRNFKKLNKTAHKDNVVDKVEFKFLKDFYKNVKVQEKKLMFLPSKKKNSAFLVDYIMNKNQLRMLRKARTGSEELDKTVLKYANKYYKREIPGIGKVSVQEYIYYSYSKNQLNQMSELLNEAINMVNSNKAEILIYLQEDEDEFSLNEAKIELKDSLNKIVLLSDPTEIEELDKRIVELSKKVTELTQKSEMIKLHNELKKLEEFENSIFDMIVSRKEYSQREKLYGMYQSNKDKIKKAKRAIEESRKSIELSHHDIYKFTMRYLEFNMKKESYKGFLKKTNPSLGDLVVASYITGEQKADVLTALFELPELQEGWEPTWKKIGKIALSVGRSLLILNPVTSPYVSLGFVVYDSVKNIGVFKKEGADAAHLL